MGTEQRDFGKTHYARLEAISREYRGPELLIAQHLLHQGIIRQLREDSGHAYCGSAERGEETSRQRFLQTIEAATILSVEDASLLEKYAAHMGVTPERLAEIEEDILTQK